MSEEGKKTYPSWERPTIKLSVTKTLHEELHNIADHEGDTLANFLRPHLRKIADSYPPQTKLPLTND